jgi:hypothetical protein
MRLFALLLLAGCGVGAGAHPGQMLSGSCGSPCLIMPLGDSITAGYASSAQGGYRAPLFDRAHADDLSLEFVGSQNGGPDMVDGVAFPKHHEGHGGFVIGDGGYGITPLTANAITTNHPKIITLMIGTNDVTGHIDLANAPMRLGTLLDLIFTTDPDVMLILAQITPMKDTANDADTMTYNAAMPGLVQTRAAAGRHITLVDMHSALDSGTDLGDNVHPNDAGYPKMADVWYQALKPLLH